MSKISSKFNNFKFFNIFLVFVLLLQILAPSAFAWGFKKDTGNVCNIQEKYDYVNINWWNNFNDPCLKEYIIRAINCNHDLKMASWKVEEYRQNVKYQFGHELPSFSVGATYAGVHLPDSMVKDFNKNIFAVPFQANYEADIFLKNKDKTKSSKKTYEASRFDEKGIYIALVTDVTTVYINIIKLDKQISLQEELVKINAELLRRENERFTRGVSNATQLNNIKKNYETSKSNLDDLTKARVKALTQLAVLVGDSPENICELKRTSFDKFDYRAIVPNEIPSDVVFSRPDILSAEAQLQKAQIDVRVARKDFLPTFNITALYAMSSLGGANFFSWQSAIAAILAGATQDLYKGGMKVANLRINKSRYEQMFEKYKQTDLTALKEVSDSLAFVDKDTQIDKNTIKNLNFQKDSYIRSERRYKSGVISYPQVLGDRELLINAEQSCINSKVSRLMDYLTLYKAVGGKL